MLSNVLKSPDADLHHLLFERAPLPLILVHGPSNRICLANQKAIQLMGKNLVTQYLHKFFSTEDQQRLQQLCEEKSEKVMVAYSKGDRHLMLDVYATPMQLENERYFQLQLVDVTECHALRKRV